MQHNPNCFRISASSIAAFKACPVRFRLGYVEGIRKVEDTDAQRIGTNWHSLHEVYHNAFSDWHWEEQSDGRPEERHEAALEAAVEYLNQRYVDTPMPSTKTIEEWDVERQILITSFIGYLWYWHDDPIEPIVSEVAFDLPLHAPRTGLPLPIDEVIRVGKIDHIVAWQSMVGPVERKSTASSIDPSSDYWKRSAKDTQVSMYSLAIHDMAEAGTLPEKVLNHANFNHKQMGNTLYDVWHKPTIKPSFLSQADTKTLIKTGEYHNQKFEVVVVKEMTLGEGKDAVLSAELTIDSAKVEIKPGKKGYSIARETGDMYAARLLSDIYTRPEFYYQRKEISRTNKEIQWFRKELFNIYQAMRMYDKFGCWFENENQCRATFTCSYIDICYGPGADAVCDGKTVPPGFKRIFTELTLMETNINEGD